MNTNSYLMLVAITIGIFILWILTTVYNLLKAHVVPLYPHNIHKSRIDKSTEELKNPILKTTQKKKPIYHSDKDLWEKEQNESRNHNSNIFNPGS